MDEDLPSFGRTYRRFMEVMTHAVDAGTRSPVRDLIDGHLGEDGSVLPVVSEGYASTTTSTCGWHSRRTSR